MTSTNMSPLQYSNSISSMGDLFKEYFANCKNALLSPVSFFRTVFSRLDLSEALTFGLLNLWLSSIITFFWDSFSRLFAMKIVHSFVNNNLVQQETTFLWSLDSRSFLMQAGLILLRPFTALLGLVFSAVVLLALSKLFINESHGSSPHPYFRKRYPKVNFPQMMRICAFAATGAWLSIVPIFGGILAYIAMIILTVIGVRESFRVSTQRACLVVLAPQIILFMGLVLIVSFVSLLALQIPFNL